MRYSQTYYIDFPSGNCSDGTNMWDWSVDRLKLVLDYCWDKDITDLAKKILNHQLEEIQKLIKI